MKTKSTAKTGKAKKATPKKKKTTTGKAANVARMKKMTSLAKSIRIKSPGKKWTNCIKEAAKQLHK